jgi:flagella basal body P-ring formation protein FlgA
MKIRLMMITFLLAAACISGRVSAFQQQNLSEIKRAAASFIEAQTRTFSGNVSSQVGDIDQRLVLGACPSLEAFLPLGAQLNGNTTVGVRCNGANGWTVFVPVTIRIRTLALTVNRPLQRGDIVTANDLAVQPTESPLPGELNDPSEAVGKSLKFGVMAGQVLTQGMLAAPLSIVQGQSVQLQILGEGFSVRGEAQALNSASENQPASARTDSGKVVSGIVRNGKIEVRL